MAEEGVVDSANDDPLDMFSEPTVGLQDLPTDDDVGTPPADADNTGATTPGDGKPEGKEQWDPTRQQADQNAASIRTLTEQVGEIAKMMGQSNQSQGDLTNQVRDAIVAANTAAREASDASQQTEDDPLGDALKAIEEMDSEELDAQQLVSAMRNVITTVQNASPKSDAALTALQTKLDATEARLGKTEERLATNEEREIKKAAKQRINSHLNSMDSKYSPGKRTFRNQAAKTAWDVCCKMGFSEENPP
ncbi:MAG: hypothetical protein GWP08_21855, partial [Nitrospiraceae bacterium]|nr:hypothetical protein [Nitrospiraceae bacterium]